MATKEHFAALIVAVISFAAISTLNVTALFECFNERLLFEYTTNWPGLEKLERHAIFDPRHSSKKKIVMLGGSNTEALGCDKTWSRKTPGQERNAHVSCSIAGQLQALLNEHGYKQWEVYNLGRNNATIVNSILTYVRIAKLKPEIVLFGADGWVFQTLGENSTFPNLRRYLNKAESASLFDDVMEELKDSYPNIRLIELGLDEGSIEPVICKKNLTVSDILTSLMIGLRQRYIRGYPPRVPEIAPYYYNKTRLANYDVKEDLVKKNFSLATVKLMPILDEIVSLNGGRLVVYQPYSYTRGHHAEAWAKNFEQDFVRVVNDANLEYLDMLRLPLKVRLEDYDAVHLTLYGNRIVAERILEFLIQRKVLQ